MRFWLNVRGAINCATTNAANLKKCSLIFIFHFMPERCIDADISQNGLEPNNNQ